ncbi:MAG: 4a-hydroxytetrahydrobiopterin dehydratase [Frankia sp.]
MPTKLDADLVADALVALPGWTGGTDKIARTVDLEDDTADAVAAEVATTAAAMDHHPVVDRDGSATTFQVWTHSAGGVTELDIALASRISDILRQHGAPPPPAATIPPPAAPADGPTDGSDTPESS